VIAAAIADPIVEALSNAGLFGAGNFTDHSNLDVLPALACGTALLAVALVLRVRRDLLRASGDALRTNLAALLPWIFAIHLGALFAMETSEQIVVAGHPLGGTIWLGGPAWFSLTMHALVCTAVAFALARVACACVRTTVRIVRRLRALAMRALHGPPPLALRSLGAVVPGQTPPVLCRIGNRAPPLLLA
ncbi:MAG TPA: hypothetical protein VMD47_07700, partial [Candidatus Acidoferrales bacterium]|nr:hypothetical protein [Candidatus Acidoferrales bacterium]